MRSLRKAIGLIVLSVLLMAGYSTGQAKPWWQSYSQPSTHDLPSDYTSAHRQRRAQESPQAESPKKADSRWSSYTERPSAPAAGRSQEFKQQTPGDAYERKLSEAQAHERAGHKAMARTVYHLLIAEHPSRPEAYHRMGQLAAREGHYQEAEGLHAQSLVLDPRNVEARNDLGYCLYCQGRLKRAERVMQQAVALRSSDRQLHANLGAIYGHQGRMAEALEQFRMAGSEAEACTNLAEILAAHNDRDAASNYLRQALAADPDHARARHVLDALAEPDKAGGTPSVATRAAPPTTVTR